MVIETMVRSVATDIGKALTMAIDLRAFPGWISVIGSALQGLKTSAGKLAVIRTDSSVRLLHIRPSINRRRRRYRFRWHGWRRWRAGQGEQWQVVEEVHGEHPSLTQASAALFARTPA